MIVTNEITRDEKHHVYWTKDGFRVVGITELLAQMGYTGQGFFNPDALRRGRNVHLALHYHAKNTLDPRSLSPRIRPYYDSAIELKETTGAQIIMSETMLFDSLSHLACQLDAVWKVKNDLIVVDYKTGSVGDWVKYQTAAHVNGLPPRQDGRRYRRWGVELRDDGKPAKVTEFDDPKDLATVRMFASVFYTKVNDGVIKWPKTRSDWEKSKLEEQNGNELFGSAVLAALRNGEGSPDPVALTNGANGAA